MLVLTEATILRCDRPSGVCSASRDVRTVYGRQHTALCAFVFCKYLGKVEKTTGFGFRFRTKCVCQTLFLNRIVKFKDKVVTVYCTGGPALALPAD
jgi:hypothetical protein